MEWAAALNINSSRGGSSSGTSALRGSGQFSVELAALTRRLAPLCGGYHSFQLLNLYNPRIPWHFRLVRN
jgi:hypothetical protein